VNPSLVSLLVSGGKTTRECTEPRDSCWRHRCALPKLGVVLSKIAEMTRGIVCPNRPILVTPLSCCCHSFLSPFRHIASCPVLSHLHRARDRSPETSVSREGPLGGLHQPLTVFMHLIQKVRSRLQEFKTRTLAAYLAETSKSSTLSESSVRLGPGLHVPKSFRERCLG